MRLTATEGDITFRTVKCPKCGAAPGITCYTPHPPHVERVREAGRQWLLAHPDFDYSRRAPEPGPLYTRRW